MRRAAPTESKLNGMDKHTHTYIHAYIQLNELDNSNGGVQNGEGWGEEVAGK